MNPASNRSIGPNTNLSLRFLKSTALVCAGENSDDLLALVTERTGQAPSETFEYRCYRFWTFDTFLLIWTGFGTGCIEPLLYELLRASSEGPHAVKQLILVGTAGRLPNDHRLAPQPKAYWIDKAYFGPTGLQAFNPASCVYARHHGRRTLSSATIISTDTFYLFTTPQDVADAILRVNIEKYWSACSLIDMEVAPFYYLCERFAAEFALPSLSYVAVKSPSNDVGNSEQQIDASRAALDACLCSVIDLI